jgi:DNA-directed RNA polymerase I subunit RPA2
MLKMIRLPPTVLSYHGHVEAEIMPAPTFDTLARQEGFRYPTNSGSTFPILNQFVQPHLESFNALFDDSGQPVGGLLSLAIRDIGERVVFDGKGITASGSDSGGWGHRMRRELIEQTYPVFCCSPDNTIRQVWIENVSIARPLVPDKDVTATERKVFPTEVSV